METTKQRYCPRCAKLGTRRVSATEEIWDCRTHGVIWKAPLENPEQKPAAPMPAAGARAPEAATTAAAGTPRLLHAPAPAAEVSLPMHAGVEQPEPAKAVFTPTGTPRRLR